MRVMRWIGNALVLCGLTACGGGGGGEGGGGGSSPQPLFTIEATSASFNAAFDGPTPSAQRISGSIVNATSTVFLFVTHTNNGLANATVQLTGATTGELMLFARPPSAVGPGTHADTVTVRACLDSACNTQISGSPKTISVTYNVVGLTASAEAVALVGVEGNPSAAAVLELQTFAESTQWSTQVDYFGGALSWLDVTPSSGASRTASLSLQGKGHLAPGTYTARLNITADALTLSLPVSYSVSQNLGIDALGVSFDAVTGQSSPAAQKAVNVTAFSPTTYTTEIRYDSRAADWLAVSGSDAPGAIALRPTRTDLAPGAYSAEIVLRPRSGHSTLSVPVLYTLSPASLTLSADAVTFAIDASSTSADTVMQRIVTTGDTGATVNWTASSPVSWLTVTASGVSGSDAVVRLVPEQLASAPNGASSTAVTFTYTATGFGAFTRTLAVTLNLNLPTVNYVAPYVAYVNQSQEVIITGSGFSQPGLGPVMFGALAAQASTVRSDTEIRALPPANVVADRYEVSIGNNLSVDRSRAQLVVRSQAAYAYSSLATNIGPQNLHLIHDAERDAVFSASAYFAGGNVPPSVIRRFQYNAGSDAWSMESRPFNVLYDIAMSPDGRELLVLTETHLHRLDPVSLFIQGSAELPERLSGSASQLAVANDGQVLVLGLNRRYSLLNNAFTALPMFGMAGIDISADGSRAVMGAATNSGDVPLSYYDAGTGAVLSTNAFQYYASGSLSRSGSKLVAGSFVRDSGFSVFGELRNNGLALAGDVIDPSGSTVYSYAGISEPWQLNAAIRVFDARASAAVLPELSSITLADSPGRARLLVSQDGRTLFVVGDERFVVQPLQ